MTKVRYMTEEEEFEDPNQLGFVIPKSDTEEAELVLKRGQPIEEIGETIRHELGHIWYPVDLISLSGTTQADWERNAILILLSELSANYYSLKIQPRDSVTRDSIRENKRFSREVDGLSGVTVSRIDRLARGRVDYKGGEVR